MSRKPTRGYFVRGQFVALGSELDLELKREQKGADGVSKTDLKRESTALQRLGEDLLGLRAELLARLDLPEVLIDALAHARRITHFEGRRRQMQFVGKLMRKLPPETLEAARAALDEQHRPSAADTRLLHAAETWREQLLAEDAALTRWMALHPDDDAQALRQLIRQTRKDVAPGSPGAAVRQGRNHRLLFQHLRERLRSPDETHSRPDEDFDDDD